jgi:hypothetical protein
VGSGVVGIIVYLGVIGIVVGMGIWCSSVEWNS